MGIDGISGGGNMARLQALKANQGGPDLQRLQEVGSELDQKVKQLDELVKNAIASGATPENLRALQAQLAQLQQVADASQNSGPAGVDAAAGTQNTVATLDADQRLDELKRKLEAALQATLQDGAALANQQNVLQQQPNALGQDQNMVQGRDMMAMY